MIDRIRALCKENKTNFSRLERVLGFANGSLAKTKEDTVAAIRVKAIADYFHCSMEYLMTGEDPATPYFPLSLEERDLVAAYRLADEVTQNNICKLLDIKKVSGLSPEEKNGEYA